MERVEDGTGLPWIDLWLYWGSNGGNKDWNKEPNSKVSSRVIPKQVKQTRDNIMPMSIRSPTVSLYYWSVQSVPKKDLIFY